MLCSFWIFLTLIAGGYGGFESPNDGKSSTTVEAGSRRRAGARVFGHNK